MSKRQLKAFELCHIAFDLLNTRDLKDMCRDLVLHIVSDPYFSEISGKIAAAIVLGDAMDSVAGADHHSIDGLINMLSINDDANKELFRSKVVGCCIQDDTYAVINLHLMKHGVDTAEWRGDNPNISWYTGSPNYAGQSISESIKSTLAEGQNHHGEDLISNELINSVNILPTSVGLELTYRTPIVASNRSIDTADELTATIIPYDTIGAVSDLSGLLASQIISHLNRVKWGKNQSAGAVD